MKANFYYLAGLVGIILSSCATDVILDDKIETKNDSHFLKVEVTDKFAAAATRADYSGFPTTTFEEDDAIGMYAFNGTTYVASNVRYVKQSDGSWLPDEDVPYCDGYTYYAYFPYRSTVYTPSTSGTVDAIDTKFADFIEDGNNYFWQADQSTKAGFTYSNLMIAKGTVTDVGEDEATVKFTMVHKRGLAIVSAANKWYYTDATGTKYTATPVFDGANVPYDEGGTLYYLVKPDVNTSAFGRTINLPAGEYKSCPIKLTGTPTYQYSVSTNQGSTWGSFSSSKPSWLTITPNETEGQPTEFEVSMTDDLTTSISLGTESVSANTTLLKNAASVSDVDLSMVDNAGETRASRMTANCYLVHAPGTYKIPLVYGNAIKNGTTNTLAYQSNTAANSNKRDNLINHADANITDPWLKNNNATPDDAELVWQDVNGLIKEGSLSIDGDFLKFEVDAEKIAEGNAVIAAKKDGIIVWSWHVWVTPETLAEIVAVNTTSHTYSVAPVNVGWVTPAATYTRYAGSLCRVRVCANTVTMEFQVTQPDNLTQTATIAGHNPYYQWGRKDPEIPMNGYSNYNHDTWDINGTSITTTSTNQITVVTGANSIGTTIQNPIKHYCNNANPYNEIKYNYWDINQTGTGDIATATIKTVYDPCPPGFCVPTSHLYYWMKSKTSTWTSTTNLQGRMLTENSYNIFFPASGQRAVETSRFSGGRTDGYCWSASVIVDGYNRKRATYLYSLQSNFNNSNSGLGYGNSIRAVLEE